MVFGIARSAPLAPMRWLAAIYTNFVRGIPILIILLFLYYEIPLLFPYATFSAGVTAVDRRCRSTRARTWPRSSAAASRRSRAGSWRPAEALGINYVQQMRYVVLPQALKIAVPPGDRLPDRAGQGIVAGVGHQLHRPDPGRPDHHLAEPPPLSTFLIVAALYFVISYPLSLLGRWYERRLA